MVAPAVAASAMPIILGAAKSAQHTISEALTADLAVIRWEGKTPRKRKGIARTPVEYEVHINPAALGVAAVGAGLSLWLMQLRLQPTSNGSVVLMQRQGFGLSSLTSGAVPDAGSIGYGVAGTGSPLTLGPDGFLMTGSPLYALYKALFG